MVGGQTPTLHPHLPDSEASSSLTTQSTKDYGRDRDGDRKGTFDFPFSLRRLTSASQSTTSDEVVSRASTLRGDEADGGKGALGLNLLHLPSESRVDLVFIHGLGGGSRKTWSKTSLARDFWPAEWLPKDPAFSCVRIHSYGYDSDWTKANANCLNIHHFGRSLLMELATSPHIESSASSIVLVGHSMGGLVIKKAYMLARQDRLFTSLAARIRAIYFLGTPHRGSDSAKVLKNILHVASSAPSYVTELVRGSGSLQAINDEFRQFSDELELWSFYETRKLSSKGFSTLIVDPESATLGYRDERQIPMNADHRSICKFDTPHDQNYTIIRNSLVSTITRLSGQGRPSLPDSVTNTSQEPLQDWLALKDSPEDDLNVVQEVRVAETCEWFLGKESYCRWKDCASAAPPLFWLSGKPATGKSVISGAVVHDLQSSGSRCAYYFFKHSDNLKSRMSTCLRALVLQMASLDSNVRRKLSVIQKEGIKIDLDNDRNIWRSLFVSGILPVLEGPYCWVIDALDECSNMTSFLESILPKLCSPTTPLRVFITSRQVPSLMKQLSTFAPSQVTRHEISGDDSLKDIKRLVDSRAGALVAEDERSRAALTDKVVQKSNGLFLWTRLVLDELSNAFSEEGAKQVLDEVPRGMECLYHRTLDSMEQATTSRGRALALAILEWTSCATRPLAVQELGGALEIQLRDKFPNLGDTITTLCGQLVTVDKASRVQMIHETAREFLTDENLSSAFAVQKKEAHTRIAKVCLEYLVGDELKPPRTARRAAGHMQSCPKRSPFFAYALAAFSHHLVWADPQANDLLGLVNVFLKVNILSWIEHTAKGKSLALMVRVAKDLKLYHDLCIVERSPLNSDMQRMKMWTTDLQRVAAKFSDALITCPFAIYSLISPFCPAQSAIHNTSASGRRLAVVGLPNPEWDDRLSCIDFQQGKTSALCYGEEYLAVGLIGGRIGLYHPTSSQEFRTLQHGETIIQLDFKSKSDILASCGMKTIRIWDVRTGQCLHTLPAPRKCLKVWFEADALLAASSKSEILSWDLESTPAAVQPKRPWRDSPDPDPVFLARPPMAFSIGVAHQMLAVGYSGQPITIWDLEGDAYYGNCGKKSATGETENHPLQALQFNPNKTIELLAASYLDGDLVILDPFNDIEIERQRMECHTLTASPDGRFLAGGTAGGVIQIFKFDTLKPVYKVRTSDLWIKQLAFSYDGMQLADLRGSQCNIWTPPVLLGGSVEDDASVDTSNTYTDMPNTQKQPKITVLVSIPAGVVCGKEDGSVSLFDLASGCLARELYRHMAPVRILQWLPKTKTILSVCVSNRIQAWPLERLKSNTSCKTEPARLDARLDCEGNTIVSVTVGEAAGKLLLSTRQSDHLWDIKTATEESQLSYEQEKQAVTRLWLQHPTSTPHVVCIGPDTADMYTWKDWTKVLSVQLGVSLSSLQIKTSALFMVAEESRVLLELEEIDGSANTKKLVALCLPGPGPIRCPSATSSSSSTSTAPTGPTTLPDHTVATHLSDTILQRLAHVIGVHSTASSSKLVFLDSKSWVCSVDLITTTEVPSYMRHFFVPYDWFAGSRRLLSDVAANKSLVFAKNGDVAIVKGGLDVSEVVSLEFSRAHAVETETTKT